MPVKIVHPNHIEIMGFGHVLLASPAPSNTLGDLDMGEITEEAALTSRAFAVIGKPRRGPTELNTLRPHDEDLRKGIEGFLLEDGIRYILEVEGKAEPGVGIDLTGGKTCSESTLALVKSRLESQFAVKPVEVPETDSSQLGRSYARIDAKGVFLVESVRVTFGSEERQFSKEKVISLISEICDLLNGRVGPSSAD